MVPGKNNAKLVEGNTSASKTYHDVVPASGISEPKKISNDKSLSPKQCVPPTSNKKRRSTVREKATESIIANALKRFVSIRSHSQPATGRESVDKFGDARENSKTRFSLFESPFDPDAEDEKETYRYDFNISHHKNQQTWVEEFLLPILETELGFRCYINERDSLPGVSTVKNISAAVKESRVTILCFSKDYLTSSWQNYEALLAHHADPGGWKKKILPIMVESCALPFKYTIYATLKWPECTMAEKVPASVRLRRRFFVFGLLNALGVHSKEQALKINKTYCCLNVPVAVKSNEH